MDADYRNDEQAAIFAELTAENGEGFPPFRWQMVQACQGEDEYKSLTPCLSPSPPGFGAAPANSRFLHTFIKGDADCDN